MFHDSCGTHNVTREFSSNEHHPTFCAAIEPRIPNLPFNLKAQLPDLPNLRPISSQKIGQEKEAQAQLHKKSS